MTHLNDISKIYLEQVAALEEGAIADKLRAMNAAKKQEWDEKGNKAKEDAENALKKVKATQKDLESASFIQKEALDPVGKENADIDNDGDVDNSDEYLHKKRKAIGKAISKKKGEECDDCGKKECECDDKKVDEGILNNPEHAANFKKNADAMAAGLQALHAKKKKTRKEEVELEERNVHGDLEVPSKDIKSLVAKAVKRIDTDVDGDVEANDKNKGEYGEFVPTPDGKGRAFAGPNKVRKESFSNWRQELMIEVSENDSDSDKISDKKVNNYSGKTKCVTINPEMKEEVESLGGQLLEFAEVDTIDINILDEMTDFELDLLSDEMIESIVEEVFEENISEGMEIEDIENIICESIESSLLLLSEGYYDSAVETSKANAKKPEVRAANRRAKLERIKSAVKGAAKSAYRGTSRAAGIAAGTAARGASAATSAARRAGEAASGAAKSAYRGASRAAGSVSAAAERGASAATSAARRAGDIASRAKASAKREFSKGYESGRKRSSSEGGGSSETRKPQPYRNAGVTKKPGLLSRIGSKLKRGLKKAVASGARSVSRGARNIARRMEEQVIAEKSVSVSQQQAAGAALAAKRGEKEPSTLKGASLQMYKSMSEKELRDFAKTKHEGLPEKSMEEGYYGRYGIRRPDTKLTPGKDYGGYKGGDDSTRTLGGKFQSKDNAVVKPVDKTIAAVRKRKNG